MFCVSFSILLSLLKINYLDLIMEFTSDRKKLIELAHYKMPFGKFKERYLLDLPEAYLVWFQRNGFPKGKLGEQMRAVLEIKINGLEGLIRKIREEFPMDTQ
jgi:uncharacterized protein (DUF3820 family)